MDKIRQRARSSAERMFARLPVDPNERADPYPCEVTPGTVRLNMRILADRMGRDPTAIERRRFVDTWEARFTQLIRNQTNNQTDKTMNNKNWTYDLHFSPGETAPEGGIFDDEKALLNRIREVDEETDFGPLAVGDGEVTIYEGDAPDPDLEIMSGPIVGVADAHLVLLRGYVHEDDIRPHGTETDESKIIGAATDPELLRAVIGRIREAIGRPPTQDDLDYFLVCFDGAISEELDDVRHETTETT